MSDDTTTRILDELRRALAAIDQRSAQDFIGALAGPSTGLRAGAREVFVTGQGRSGLIAAAFAVRLAHLGLRVHVVGEPTAPAVAAGAVLVACSGSGRTGVTLLRAERALAAGAQVWAITQDRSSPLASAATHVVVIPDVASAQPGASIFEQALLVFLDAVVMELMARLGETESSMLARHANLE
jgi:6-phospho-3-hexuloisomerase